MAVQTIPSSHISPAWVGSQVSFVINNKPISGGLSDYQIQSVKDHPERVTGVALFVAGQIYRIQPTSTITRRV